MSGVGCTGVVVVIGELTYLGPLWFIPGLIGGIVGHHLDRTSKWRPLVGGALGAAIAFGGMYLGLLILY